MGHPALRYALPPSTSPDSPDFRRRTYWRGPVWPFLNLLLGWAAARDQAWELHAALRDASLRQLARPDLRRVLRADHRRAARQPAAGLDGRRGAGVAGLTAASPADGAGGDPPASVT